MNRLTKKFFSRLAVIAEPNKPQILTSSLPGPNSESYMAKLANIVGTTGMDLPIDLEKSLGNYFQDLDGNQFLDMSGQMGTVSLGYNHPEILKYSKSPEVTRHVTNRLSLAIFPPEDLEHLVNASFMKICPPELDSLYSFICSNCTIEVALKLAFIDFQSRKRTDPVQISDLDLDSCMNNQQPGAPDLSVLSFDGSIHGKTFGGLSVSSSEDMDVSGVPLMKWPKLGVPQYKYPVVDHQEYNLAQDQKVLAEVEQVIDTWESEIVGAIIEPIQTDNGGFMFSAYFGQELRKLLTAKNLVLIVDETRTGYYSTGKLWAYEHWQLDSPPDFVCISNKILSGGLFTSKRFTPPSTFRHFHTWYSDTPRMALLAKQNELIEQSQVTTTISEVGAKLMSKLQKMCHKGLLTGVRGIGTFLTFDVKDRASRDALVDSLKQNGVLVSASGEKSINLRPSLIFEKKHAKIFTSILKKCLKSI